ncbi:MAG: hypothetical protein U0S12_14235 [Fimbriimonadales bacterium]
MVDRAGNPRVRPACGSGVDDPGFGPELFFALELAAGFVAYRMAKRSPKPLAWLFLQRFAYRQIMYGVIYKSLIRALTGGRQGWGKLQRKGTVTVSSR